MHGMMMLIVKFLLMMMRMSLAFTAGLMRAKAGLEAASGTVEDATEPFGTYTRSGFADLTHVSYADGLAITGEATFAKSDGTTGTVANTTLASDVNGYAITSIVVRQAAEPLNDNFQALKVAA